MLNPRIVIAMSALFLVGLNFGCANNETIVLHNAASDSAEGKSSTLGWCLPGNAYGKIPVQAGVSYKIKARIADQCHPKGWAIDRQAFSGPAGVPNYFHDKAIQPAAVVGTLVGQFSHENVQGRINEKTARRIFHNALIIRDQYVVTSPVNGYLYMICNDTWSYHDNVGAIEISVTR